ncbi:MAG: hypothetical protein II030_07525, partial [Treponema sp.]|nr:hypothetical protein [Treponema sp.]
MKGYDIAYECGFSDPHYFSYIFKKKHRPFPPRVQDKPIRSKKAVLCATGRKIWMKIHLRGA